MNVSMLITSLREKKYQLIMIIHPSPSSKWVSYPWWFIIIHFCPRKLTYHIPFLKGPFFGILKSFLRKPFFWISAPFELVLLRDSSPLRSGDTDPSLPVGGKPGVLLRKHGRGLPTVFHEVGHHMGCLVRGARVFTGDFFRKIMVPKTHIVRGC